MKKLTIETIKPDLSEVSLINDTDGGKSTVDRLTNFADLKFK